MYQIQRLFNVYFFIEVYTVHSKGLVWTHSCPFLNYYPEKSW